MHRYNNISGKSGISAYEIGEEYIRVKFGDSDKVYTYSYGKAGKTHVEKMKSLAQKGSGLNTYLNKHVHKLHDD